MYCALKNDQHFLIFICFLLKYLVRIKIMNYKNIVAVLCLFIFSSRKGIQDVCPTKRKQIISLVNLNIIYFSAVFLQSNVQFACPLQDY